MFLNATEEVFLVGDDKQSRLREPDEGFYIGNRIPLTNLSTHTLLVNFRNPPDTVALLKKLFGYQMHAAKPHQDQPSVVFVKSVDETGDKPALEMAFSKAGAKQATENESNTVRANQGGTFPLVKLHLSALDKETPEQMNLQTVALSRHTEKI